jgi:hypothetical protein
MLHNGPSRWAGDRAFLSNVGERGGEAAGAGIDRDLEIGERVAEVAGARPWSGQLRQVALAACFAPDLLPAPFAPRGPPLPTANAVRRPGVVAGRLLDETWLFAALPLDTRDDACPVPATVAAAIEPLGEARWARLEVMHDAEGDGRAARRRERERAALAKDVERAVAVRFPDEPGTATIRRAAEVLDRALSPLGLDRRRGGESRIAIWERPTPQGNVLRITLDLAGIAPGPWSPAVNASLRGPDGEIRIALAPQAYVTSATAWSDRCARIFVAADTLVQRHLAALDAALGPAPAWMARLRPEVRLR